MGLQVCCRNLAAALQQRRQEAACEKIISILETPNPMASQPCPMQSHVFRNA